MRRHKWYIFIAIFVFLISIVNIFYLLEAKLAMNIFFSLLLILSFIFFRKRVALEMLVAFIIAFLLVLVYPYEYTTSNIFIGKINLFSLVAWTFGLVVLREIYKDVKWKNKLVKVFSIYLAIMFAVEYIGYYLLNIKLNSNYPSFLGIGILHSPLPLQLFYIFIGLFYLLILNFLEGRK